MANKVIDRLYYLSVIAEEQNITKAAERLYISQPALTSFLNRLENEIGVLLFDRSSVPIRLTEAGRYYIAEMRRLEDLRNQIILNTQHISANSSALRIGFGQNRGSLWLPETLSLLKQEFPDLEVSIREDRDVNMVENVARNTLDVAILETFAFLGDLYYEPVGYESHCIITGYNHPAFTHYDKTGNGPGSPLRVSAQEINQLTFICPGIQSALNDYTQWLFANYHLNPARIFFITNNSTAYQLAVKNFGCTFLCVRYAKMHSTCEKPLFLMPNGQPAARRLYAVYPTADPLPSAKAFTHALSRVMSDAFEQSQVPNRQ